jgi:16S rRNA (guanine(966)-N(2))-methyltransferase RsmD
LRVIAGTHKGRRLAAPTWIGLRPTSDKLRETLFNILASRVPGARVLDLCAGTGALGIEALSRGAAHVTFVDRDRRAVSLIGENLGRCGITEGYAMIRGTAEAAAASAALAGFDLILLDPPYDLLDPGAMVAAVGAWLVPGGLLVLEHARRRPAPASAGPVTRVREVASGDSALAFYARVPGDALVDREEA